MDALVLSVVCAPVVGIGDGAGWEKVLCDEMTGRPGRLRLSILVCGGSSMACPLRIQ